MSDPTALLAAADRLADRFRSMPQGRLAQLAPDGLLLARRLARRAEQIEGGARRPELPEAGIFAVGDQIALAAHDLATALAGGSEAAGPAGEAGDEAAEEEAAGTDGAGPLLSESLRELEAAYRLATTRSARM
ncbi:hypothetical protein [Streptacidiphilus sp. PAMC 29251]